MPVQTFHYALNGIKECTCLKQLNFRLYIFAEEMTRRNIQYLQYTEKIAFVRSIISNSCIERIARNARTWIKINLFRFSDVLVYQKIHPV